MGNLRPPGAPYDPPGVRRTSGRTKINKSKVSTFLRPNPVPPTRTGPGPRPEALRVVESERRTSEGRPASGTDILSVGEVGTPQVRVPSHQSWIRPQDLDECDTRKLELEGPRSQRKRHPTPIFLTEGVTYLPPRCVSGRYVIL